MKEKIICIGCPLGCEAEVYMEKEEIKVEGCKCKQGIKYVVSEYKNPVRVLTATVLTNNPGRPLLPVRTDAPIPKSKLRDGMRKIAGIRIKGPVKCGDVIEKNFLDLGVNLIATSDLD